MRQGATSKRSGAESSGPAFDVAGARDRSTAWSSLHSTSVRKRRSRSGLPGEMVVGPSLLNLDGDGVSCLRACVPCRRVEGHR